MSLRAVGVAVVVAILATLGAGTAVAREGAADPGSLRLNHLQARGTHNSYHRDPGFPGREAAGWDYSHAKLERQLEEQGVRQVELDVHYNWARDDFEVYHAWFGDDRSTCQLLRDCLAELRLWSDAHPDHPPLMVLIEPKDEGPPRNAGAPADGDPFTSPMYEAEYEKLDRVVLESFGGASGDGGRVLTPDDVTASGLTLRKSIVEHGWPKLRDVRQKVLFVVDGEEHGREYSRGWSDLSGRAMFVQAEADQPVAAFVSRDGARLPGEEKCARMARLVAAGFMVRDYVDVDGFEASKAAGAHFISSDYPGDLELSGDALAPSRCNPVSAVDVGCTDRRIETHTPGHGYELPPEPSDELDQVVADKLDRVVVRSAESAVAASGG